MIKDNELFYSLAKELKELKDKKADLEQQMAANTEAIHKLEKAFVDVLQSHGLESIVVEDIGTCFITDSPFVNLEDSTAFFAYLREHGNEHMIRKYVPPSTVKKYVKEVREQQNIIPDGIKYTPNPVVRIRRQ